MGVHQPSMKITLRIKDNCTPETARSLIQLAKQRTGQADIDLDLTIDQGIARGLLEDDSTWQPKAVPNGFIPRLCKVLEAVEGDNEDERRQAIADLKNLLGID